jgi:Spy/CpxP family protein refolding chaperone
MKRSLFLWLCVLLSVPAFAESPNTPDSDPVSSKLFAPDLIMAHQRDLGVDDAQRTAILKEIEKSQGPLTQLQWKLQAAAEELGKILDGGKIDEAKALAQADKVMALEHDMKRGHLGLLIRLKNLLSAEQRAKLVEIRGAQR